MIKIKNKQAIEKMRMAGALLARVMKAAEAVVRAGVATSDIDAFVEAEMLAVGLVPECKGYGTYKHATCISVNDVVVHGVPSRQCIIKEGDCVSVDMVGSYKGYCADMARTFLVGNVDPEVRRLAHVAQQALDAGLACVKPGVRLSNMSAKIQEVVEAAGFGVLRDFVGHGIGRDMHEDPQVPNFGRPGEGPILQVGMTLAVEPMITQKGYAVRVMEDGWTVKTVDGGYAAHVEDTILVGPYGAEILTRLA